MNEKRLNYLIEELYYSNLNEYESMELNGYINDLQKENQQLKDKINKALSKINNMFDLSDETRIIDDLLELDKILKGDKQ